LPETCDERTLIFDMEKLDRAKAAFEKQFIRFKVDQMNGDLPAAAKQMGTSLNLVKKKVSEN
jgi:DNA-binding NtrC family response regulator